jgi:hypothetical protein
MSLCRVCMADITWSVTTGGEKIPLDDHEEYMASPPDTPEDKVIRRYRVVEENVPPLIEPVGREFAAAAKVDHRSICQQPRVV